MKTNFLKIVTLSVLIGTLAISCSKYEENTGISLRSKKARLTGSWKIVKVIEDGVERELDQIEKALTLKIESDDSYSYDIPGFDNFKGTWEFKEGKEELELKDEDGSTERFLIQKLTNSELWIDDKSGLVWQMENQD